MFNLLLNYLLLCFLEQNVRLSTSYILNLNHKVLSKHTVIYSDNLCYYIVIYWTINTKL
jgi:hypothetical protein